MNAYFTLPCFFFLNFYNGLGQFVVVVNLTLNHSAKKKNHNNVKYRSTVKTKLRNGERRRYVIRESDTFRFLYRPMWADIYGWLDNWRVASS